MLPESRNHARILVVDDNKAMLKLIGSLLEEQGAEVELVNGVDAAKEALESSCGRKPFDLVLSDISMPGKSGFDLLAWIKGEKSRHHELPVLLMTAQLPGPENRIKGLSMGAVDYVERPDDINELVIRAMNAVTNYRRLRSLEASLHDSEKLALVGRLLAASNHEIRNLASLVRLATEMIAKQFSGAIGDGARALEALEQSSALLVEVVKSTSNLLTADSALMKPLDLTAVVREVASLMVKRVSPVYLTVAPQESIWVNGHAVRIKQVLINLILNAFEAIEELNPEEGGSIHIEVKRLGEGLCSVVVRDNGIGLESSSESAAFNAFSTTKKLRGGTGLGLWLSANLMRSMNGNLKLASAGPAQGASATLSLKVCDSPIGEPEWDISQYFIDQDNGGRHDT